MMRKRRHRQHFVMALSASATRGTLVSGWLRLPCALGRSGQRAIKREGDGATPVGRHRVERLMFRADRGPRPGGGLPTTAIAKNDGWCDAPEDRNYNRPVRHPYGTSAEHLWRTDALYDVVVILDHNQRPRVRGGGSAIFLHIARGDGHPTEGCVAVSRAGMRHLLGRLSAGDTLIVGTSRPGHKKSPERGRVPG
ncbi:MAG: L,D-transpeptidase family protein [Hyphomicrobium sp.]|nr:L,D-transpeptidase family protein [Hyphomicrobium sp.]